MNAVPARRGGIRLLICLALTLALLSACSGNGQSTDAVGERPSADHERDMQEGGEAAVPNSGTLLSEQPVTFRWLATDRREAPIRNDWPIFEEMYERTHVKIEFEPVPDGIAEKRQILIATNSVTDFMPVPLSDARAYGPEGVFLNLNDYLDMAPNIVSFFERHPDARKLASGADGGLYAIPVHEGTDFGAAWIVRQDLMEQLGIDAPSNPEEFYQMLSKMKQQHPDAYPLIPYSGTFNNGGSVFTALIRSFTGLEGLLPFDPEKKEYVFTPEQPGFAESLHFMHKLHAEQLLDPEFAIITAAQWEERMLSGKSFVTWYAKSRVETFDNSGKESQLIPGYDIHSFPTFSAEGVPNYQFSRSAYAKNGLALSNKLKDKETAVKFLDYLVSEEGSDYLALGIEGETYERVNGEAKFLDSLGPAPYSFLRGEYGVWYPDINLDMGKSRSAEVFSEKAQSIQDMYASYVLPAPSDLVFTDEENQLQKDKLNNLNAYMDQSIAEFVAGRKPITEQTVQSFIDQCIKLGAYELRDMFNASYQRTYGGN